jgi:hypothetical protein
MGRASYMLDMDGGYLWPHTDASSVAAMRSESRRFYLQHAALCSGGYDAGGAYWGTGERVYLARSVDGRVFTSCRARNRADAMRTIREEFPRATFFGGDA